MESIRELFKIGVGPSSSHTMGPQKICLTALERYGEADEFHVTLYGSLALTGKGHLTDYMIEKTLTPSKVQIDWQLNALPRHPNGMTIEVFKQHVSLGKLTAYSIGGGSVIFEGEGYYAPQKIYKHHTFQAIRDYVEDVHIDLYHYILQTENDTFPYYLDQIFHTMMTCVENGLKKEGVLPGKLALKRVARALNQLAKQEHNERLLVTSYAYAVSEQNASGQTIVTAPTCGASGVLPALLFYAYHDLQYSLEECKRALAIAGLIGNLVKYNATISGAEGGCQAEIGTATAMSAAAYAALLGLDINGIEYAAEMGLEHQLGLTCDPVGGYVQIPCIERNGFGVLRALDAGIYAKELTKIRKQKVSFDSVVRVMRNTGHDLKEAYRETSLGGLAKELSIE